MQRVCPRLGIPFEISPQEMALRKKLGIDGEPETSPVFRFLTLGAFWPHWNLHQRTCDKTGKQIITPYRQDCPQPVWHHDEWMDHADPPGADFDPARNVFDQLLDLFNRSPIPHTIGTGNENCEYADDWWYSKNCYVCHSGTENEDCRYCYRIVRMKNCHFCVYSFDSERCVELTMSHNCFQSLFLLLCWSCTDCAFLYDCRNCNHCFLCSNLRNKQYCIRNEQFSKEEYERRMQEWPLRSRATYNKAKTAFLKMLKDSAWHRALFNDRTEDSSGNYCDQNKKCRNCFFFDGGNEDCVNIFRGFRGVKDTLDAISPVLESELLYQTSIVQDQCYDVQLSFDCIQCKELRYCGHCFQCEHCFGCCGLRGKKYCILNKQHSEQEYRELVPKVIAHMRNTEEYGKFFPGVFSPAPYDESIAGFFWPLTEAQKQQFGFRLSPPDAPREHHFKDPAAIPDRSDEAAGSLENDIFWDATAKKPFQIQKADCKAAATLGSPLPHTHYVRRLQENYRLVHCHGLLRGAQCSRCRSAIQTEWPEEYRGRILCEGCYLKEVY